MSKVLLAIVDGKAKEFKALVDNSIRFVVEFDGRFYTNNSGRFIPLAKSRIKMLVASSGALN